MSMWSSIKPFYCLMFSAIDNYFPIQLYLLDVVLSLRLILKCLIIYLGQAKHRFEQFTLTEQTNSSCIRLLQLRGT